MTVESYLATPFDYKNYVVADETDLRTKIEARLAASGWTNVSGHKWQSPDAARFIQVDITLPGAGVIRFAVTDYNGHALQERLFTVAASEAYDIFINPYGLYVSGPATTKYMICGLLDHFPEDANSHDRDAFVAGTNYDGGASGDNCQQLLGLDNAHASARMTMIGYNIEYDASKAVLRKYTGIRREGPVIGRLGNPDGFTYEAGHMYQIIAVEGALGIGAKITAIIDTDTTADFRVIAVPNAAANYLKYAARMA